MAPRSIIWQGSPYLGALETAIGSLPGAPMHGIDGRLWDPWPPVAGSGFTLALFLMKKGV